MRARPKSKARYTQFLGLAALLATSASAADWALPSNGFDLLRALQQGPTDISTDAGLAAYGSAIAVEGFVFGVVAGTATHLCIPNGATNKDLNLVVRAFLEQNTHRLSEKAAQLVLAAAEKAFPCN
jgi:hypothetical protein